MQRMEVYKSQTEPILEFFKADELTTVIDFEPKRGLDDFPKVRDIMTEILEKR